MPRRAAKRGPPVIDLVSSEIDEAGPPPSKKISGPRAVSFAQNGAGNHGAGPSSAHTAASSQNATSDEVDEPDLFDLTQAPDGPARKLYGNLGANLSASRCVLLLTASLRHQDRWSALLQRLRLTGRGRRLCAGAQQSGMTSICYCRRHNIVNRLGILTKQ